MAEQKINSEMLSNNIKAFVNFNGIGTLTIRGSFNVSSITDNGVGDYNIIFSNPVGTTRATTASSEGTTGTSQTIECRTPKAANNTSQQVITRQGGSGNIDRSNISVIITSVG